jgi:hypothetical protein
LPRIDTYLPPIHDSLEAAAALVVILTAIVAIDGWRRTKAIERELQTATYLPIDVTRYTRFYVEPEFQSVDPGGAEEPRGVIATRQAAFSVLDAAFTNESKHRYIIVLADSGMGKSALLINYFRRHMRLNRRNYDIAIVQFGAVNADKLSTIKYRRNTVLLLDALDEDMQAVSNVTQRLADVLAETQDFRKVLITCRSQFFASEQEIPVETGILKTGPRGAGEPAQHSLHKLYLAPFDDRQIDRYLRKRYPFPRILSRRRARSIARRAPHVSVRPMLLTHIDELSGDERRLEYSFEIYETMVQAWFKREHGFDGIAGSELERFSELLALEIFLKRQTRGRERLTREEVLGLAQTWNLPLKAWHLTSRSLLNHDAEGFLKFAHRSIGEYLFVKRFLATPAPRRELVAWTDQMKLFLSEMLIQYSKFVVTLSSDAKVASSRNPLLAVRPEGRSTGSDSQPSYDIRPKSLARVDLSHSVLMGVKVPNLYLDEANLEHASLALFDLSGCSLRRACLRHARVDAFASTPIPAEGADFRNATVSAGLLDFLHARSADFSGAEIIGYLPHSSPNREEAFRVAFAETKWRACFVEPDHELIRLLHLVDPDASPIAGPRSEDDLPFAAAPGRIEPSARPNRSRTAE